MLHLLVHVILDGMELFVTSLQTCVLPKMNWFAGTTESVKKTLQEQLKLMLSEEKSGLTSSTVTVMEPALILETSLDNTVNTHLLVMLTHVLMEQTVKTMDKIGSLVTAATHFPLTLPYHSLELSVMFPKPLPVISTLVKTLELVSHSNPPHQALTVHVLEDGLAQLVTLPQQMDVPQTTVNHMVSVSRHQTHRLLQLSPNVFVYMDTLEQTVQYLLESVLPLTAKTMEFVLDSTLGIQLLLLAYVLIHGLDNTVNGIPQHITLPPLNL